MIHYIKKGKEKSIGETSGMRVTMLSKKKKKAVLKV